MKQFVLILTLFFGVSGVFAQQYGEIHGVIKDKNGLTLPGATVIASTDNSSHPVITDMDGKFKIKPLVPGIYKITVTFIGMQSFEINSVPVYADDVNVLSSIELKEARIDLPEAEVYTYVDPLIRKDGVSKAIIRAADIKHNPARRNIQGMIATITPQVTVNPATQELHFKGSRSGAVVYFVDGMKINGQFAGLPTAGIGSMSVYTGGVPAKYGDTTGGVIVIESKNYFDLYNERINQ